MKGFMKKTILVFVSALMLSGCTGTASKEEETSDFSNITMDELCEANDVNSLLSNHKSVLFQYGSSDSDETTDVYIDKDYLFEKYEDDSISIVSKEERWDCDYPEGEQTLNYYWYAMDETEDQEMRFVPSDYALLDKEYSSREAIENIQENEDGTLTITAVLHTADTEEFMRSNDIEYPEGHDTVEQRMVYVVDKGTLEMVSMSATLVIDDEDDIASAVEISHDVDRPDELSETLALITEAKNEEETNTRTLRVIYDYGTAEEQSYEMEAGGSYKVVLVTRDGYDFLYTDPEKKEEYTGGDGVSDMTIYAFTEEDDTETASWTLQGVFADDIEWENARNMLTVEYETDEGEHQKAGWYGTFMSEDGTLYFASFEEADGTLQGDFVSYDEEWVEDARLQATLQEEGDGIRMTTDSGEEYTFFLMPDDEEDADSLKFFTYGSIYADQEIDPLLSTVYNYLSYQVMEDEDFDKKVGIPYVRIIETDESNSEDVLVYGDYYLYVFEKHGDTLEAVSGGHCPGLIHLKKLGGEAAQEYKVQSMDEAVTDEDAKEIFGEYYEEYFAVSSDRELVETEYAKLIADYVKYHSVEVSKYSLLDGVEKQLPK